MKTDARVRYTRQALKNALLKIMETKPLKKVSVKEVCDMAEINRATFYTHYDDCFDLLVDIENDLICEFKRSLDYVSDFDMTSCVMSVYDMIDANIALCRLLVFENTDDRLIRKMIDIAHDKCMIHWKNTMKKATVAQLEMLFCCLANGLARVVAEGYTGYDRTTVADFVNTMVKTSMSVYM